MLNSEMVLRVGVLLAAGLSFGCKLGVVPAQANAQSGLSLLQATPGAPSAFANKAKITGVKGQTPDDGMSHVQVRLNVDETPAIPKFHLEALPAPANWTSAMVTLFSATANNAYAAGTHSRTIGRALFTGTPLSFATSFPPLRPANDYIARCFILNNAGSTVPLRIAGSQENNPVTLDAGINTINFNIQLNGNESSYGIQAASSSYKNKISDGYLVVDDIMDFDTGMDAAAPGVDHIDVVLSGACYGGGSCVLGRVSTPNLNTFHWDSSLDATGPGGTYVELSMTGGTLATPKTGQIEFQAFHALDSTTPIGVADVPINVYAKTSVTVQVQ